MAAHVRTQIRNAIASAVGGLTTTGARVFTSRVYPLERTDLPGLLVRIAAVAPEQVQRDTVHAPALLTRTLPVEVVGVARAVDDLDDTLDQIALEVEVALAEPVAALDGIAKYIVLQSVQVDMVDGGEKPTGTITMQYEVEYFTLDNSPDVSV